MILNQTQVAVLITILALPAMGDTEACPSLWAEHKTEYSTYVKNAQPNMLKAAQENLNKSIETHEAWLKALATKLETNEQLKKDLTTLQYRTGLLHESFDGFTADEKAVLFSSKKRFEHLNAARDKDELFEESLNQEFFGVRQGQDDKKQNVFKYISSAEELNWALIQPLYKTLKTQARSDKNENTWNDTNGVEMETKVNHFRATGEFTVSLCSRLNEEKEFGFLRDREALPPQFACSRLNLKDGSIEKGMENREEISSPAQFQAFLTETYFQEHNINQVKCLGYFLDQGSKKKILNAMR